LLYKLNDGEDGTTGPWDPTKWTQTSLAELSGADIPIGTSADTSTIAGAVGAIKAKTFKTLVSLGATSSQTISDTRMDICSAVNVNLAKGDYIVEVALPCTINSASAFFYFNIDVDGTSINLATITGPQGNITLCGVCKITIASDGTYPIKVTGRTSASGKSVTIPTSYNLSAIISACS